MDASFIQDCNAVLSPFKCRRTTDSNPWARGRGHRNCGLRHKLRIEGTADGVPRRLIASNSQPAPALIEMLQMGRRRWPWYRPNPSGPCPWP